MQELIDHFKSLIPVSDQLAEALKNKAFKVTIKKGEYLHKAGSICKHTYWIKSGLLRTYYLKDGKEVTDVFAAENDWITSAQSFMKQEVDQYYLQAIENSELHALSFQNLGSLFSEFHEMEKFGRISMSINYILLAEKLESYQFTSAKDKYNHFCRTYHPLLNRLPLGMVASYLGITQETLSRLRRDS